MEDLNRYYVYGHYHNNKLVYVGKGTGSRVFHPDRYYEEHSTLVNEAIHANNMGFFVTLLGNLPESEALYIEAILIQTYKPKFNSKIPTGIVRIGMENIPYDIYELAVDLKEERGVGDNYSIPSILLTKWFFNEALRRGWTIEDLVSFGLTPPAFERRMEVLAASVAEKMEVGAKVTITHIARLVGRKRNTFSKKATIAVWLEYLRGAGLVIEYQDSKRKGVRPQPIVIGKNITRGY